jgi:hypothetical protein
MFWLQLDHRKAEVAKFKNSKKPKRLVKQNRHRWQSFNERLDAVQVRVAKKHNAGERYTCRHLMSIFGV